MANIVEADPSCEGQSIIHPSIFNRSNYSYWKSWMINLVESSDIDAWKVSKNEPHIPKKRVGEVESSRDESLFNVANWKNV